MALSRPSFVQSFKLSAVVSEGSFAVLMGAAVMPAAGGGGGVVGGRFVDEGVVDAAVMGSAGFDN